MELCRENGWKKLGRVAQTRWFIPKPLKMFTSHPDLIFVCPKHSRVSEVWTCTLVISNRKCKVMFKWDRRKRRFGRIETEARSVFAGELASGKRQPTFGNCATSTSAQTFSAHHLISSCIRVPSTLKWLSCKTAHVPR